MTFPPFGVVRLEALRQRRQDALNRRQTMVRSALCALILLLATPFFKAHLQSIAVLDLVANKPLPAPLKILTTPITTTDLTLTLPSGTVRARLYTPTNNPNAPAIIVLHGVHHLGIDEPRLTAFASAMASTGLRVLTPELPSIKDYHVGPNSIATIGDSALYLANQSKQRPIGILGLSFSGGLALLAAADPHYQSAIKFVVAVGSHSSMLRVAQYYRTGQDPRPNGQIETLPPHEYGPLVLEYQHLEDFLPAPDIEPLRTLMRAHLYEDPAAERRLIATLTPTQLAESKQLFDTTNPITRTLLAHSETLHTAEMDTISPQNHIAHLPTAVYLLHGEGDNIIPAAETQWLAAELPPHSLQSALISPVLSHINLDGTNPSLLDQLRLIHLFALILRAAHS